ncbi:hypothetical protein SDC9_130046 [bioreactor metagenome]|uniref:Uncharacterized protein n=1 Tax=bioreactor metagenome TaxID=1076179 RepID=A0A645D1K8_9ZZZZ
MARRRRDFCRCGVSAQGISGLRGAGGDGRAFSALAPGMEKTFYLSVAAAGVGGGGGRAVGLGDLARRTGFLALFFHRRALEAVHFVDL